MWVIMIESLIGIVLFMQKGDVHVYSRTDIQRLCDESGMKLELYDVRKGFRLHCVVRKPV